VLLFLQEINQKYVFVTPESKSGVVPVHTLIAREKNGSDNKALYLISTSEHEPEIYELSVVQPRDRQDWIAGIRWESRPVIKHNGCHGRVSQLDACHGRLTCEMTSQVHRIFLCLYAVK
jgi:hypothetical protein